MKSFLLILTLCSQICFANVSDMTAHFSINGKDQVKVLPNVPSTIEVWFTNPKTQEVYKDFKPMHGKIMHMVLLKKDLSEFKHIHPYFDPITGRFQITINMPLSDPDNFHTTNTITSPGMYMLMADVDIRGIGMRMGHKMLKVIGGATMTPLKLDPVDGDLSITKYFSQHNRDYKINMALDSTAGCSGELLEFALTLYEKDESSQYIEASEIQPWLSQGAHSVWASKGLMSKNKMHFAHMHSELPMDDHSTFYFNYHNLDTMKSGVQKVWFQIKHKNKVITVPVIFEFYPELLPSNC